jgi:hypothetical protein
MGLFAWCYRLQMLWHQANYRVEVQQEPMM